jgi:hypothetical protein
LRSLALLALSFAYGDLFVKIYLNAHLHQAMCSLLSTGFP